MPHASTDRLPIRSPRAFVLVLTFKGIVVSVVQTLLIPVLEDLPQLLDTEPDNAAWVITSTLLAGAVTTPIMGRLGDLHGKRRMLICSLVPPSETAATALGRSRSWAESSVSARSTSRPGGVRSRRPPGGTRTPFRPLRPGKPALREYRHRNP